MSLATELAETNALLRQAVQAPPRREPAPVVRDHWRDLSNAPLVAVLALRSVLKPVPADYWKIGWLTGNVTIVCGCRRGHRLRPGAFHDCHCGRTFVFTGRRVFVVPVDA